MGLNTIGATGVGLPPPQALYPQIFAPGGALPQVTGTNRLSLPPGGDVLIPSGTWMISPGQYSMIQILDPVSQTWAPFSTADSASSNPAVSSDGQNFRIINPTGVPIGAMVNGSGIGYTSVPVVSVSAGSSTWLAIVGGGIGSIGCVNGFSGLNYGVAPIVNIAAPPSPGVPATAVAVLGASGAISGFTIINPGAGYTSPPSIVVVPQESDPNANSTTTKITNAQAFALTSYVGMVTAVLLVNEGTPLNTTAPALSFSTAGSSQTATATALMAWTISAVSVAATSGAGTVANIITVGGGAPTSGASVTNSPTISTQLLQPREANITGTFTGTNVTGGTIIDGGLFMTPPSAYVSPGPGTAGVVGAVTLTVSGLNDTVFITPL